MVIPCLCSFTALRTLAAKPPINKKHTRTLSRKESGSYNLGRRSYGSRNRGLSNSNGLRLLIFPQPLGGALKNQNAAPTTPPCFCRRQQSSSLHWTDCLRHFVPPPCFRPVPSETPTEVGGRNNKKASDLSQRLMFGGRYRTRTCDLLHVKQMLYQLS